MKTKWISLIIIAVMLVATLATPLLLPSSVSLAEGEPEPVELLDQRTRTSKTYYLGETPGGRQRYALDASIGSIHYKDSPDDLLEQWKEIDTDIQASARENWDWEVVKGNWHLLIREDTTVALLKDGNWLGFQYQGFAYLDIETKDYVILDTRNDVTPVVSNNKIRWENLFYGVNLEYIYTPDGFKESLEVTQVARDFLASRPPSNYGLNNQTTYLVGYLECDWQNAYQAEDAQGNAISFDDYEVEGESIFWRHPVKDYLVAALPLGYATHEELQPEEWAKIRHRFYLHDNDKHYLLFGAKVTSLNQYPAGTIVIDPSIEVQIGAVADNPLVYGTTTQSGGTFYAAGGWNEFGRSSSSDWRWQDYRFTGITIPAGATIDALTRFEFVAYLTDIAVPTPLIIYGDDNGTPTAPTDTTEFWALAETTASVEWSAEAWTAESTYYSDDIDTIVQELVDSYAPYSNGDMQFMIYPNNPVSNGLNRLPYDYGQDSAKATKLHIEYTAGGVSAPTVTSDNSSNVEETTALLSGNITATGGENADYRGFEWGTSTGIYSANVTESGNFTAGIFSNSATSLSPGTLYFWRAMAHNSANWSYGGELYLVTKPQAPTSLATSNRTNSQITLTWTKGTGSENTTIQYRTDGTYPTGYSDGTSSYNGTASTCNMTGLTAGQAHHIGAWAMNTDNTTIYSDSSAQLIAYTLPGDPTNLTSSNPACTSFDIDWTKGTGGDRSMVRYKTGSYPTDETDGTQGYFDTANTTSITSLSPATTYYVAVWAEDSDSNYYSNNSSQTTQATSAITVPTVQTDNATNISDTTTTLNGQITAIGCENASERGFEWGLSSGNYSDNWTEVGSYGVAVFSHGATGLSANTTYYYRAMATNTAGWGYGSEVSFTTTLTPTGPPGAPTNFLITQVGTNSANITWTKHPTATLTIIRVSTRGYPASPTDGYETYNGTGEFVLVEGLSLDTMTYYFRAWSWTNPYSDDYDEGTIGGEAMILIALVLLAVGLTATLFLTRESMLGFPCVMMWAVLGGYAYVESSTPWGDWQFFLAFASLLGMTTFCGLAAFGLREKRDTLAEKEMDEREGEEGEEEEEEDSLFATESRKEERKERAAKRRKRTGRRDAKVARKTYKELGLK